MNKINRPVNLHQRMEPLMSDVDDASETYRIVMPESGSPESPSLPVEETDKEPSHWLSTLFLRHLPLETETTRFILVNLLDYFMTYLLLMGAGGAGARFVESNPIARYFIESWGPVKGMLGFKLGLVTFVCLIAQIISTRRPRAAAMVLNFGTIAVSCVVVYSLILLLNHQF